MEGGDHQPTRLFTTQRLRHALFHLARSLIGKGHGRNMACLIPTFTDQMGDFVGDNTRLAGTRSRQHQARSGDEFDGLLLSGVQTHKGSLMKVGRGE
ncbi:hypothetical protein SDC9_170326 [bioreactor metagenome]|uniref:Uncharacterized protein n=1 Tax=bioreactor metagenome TaxID=1076179 RepID=A0A645G7R6_9ZZZZ